MQVVFQLTLSLCLVYHILLSGQCGSELQGYGGERGEIHHTVNVPHINIGSHPLVPRNFPFYTTLSCRRPSHQARPGAHQAAAQEAEPVWRLLWEQMA